MSAILQTTISNAFENENVWMLIKISLKFVSKGPTSNGSWRQGIKGEMTCTGYVALVW